MGKTFERISRKNKRKGLEQYSRKMLINIVPEQNISNPIYERLKLKIFKRNYACRKIQQAFRNRIVCSICFEKVQKGNRGGKVCHHFHNACINTWFSHGNITCPYCRSFNSISLIDKRANLINGILRLNSLQKSIKSFDKYYFEDDEGEKNFHRKIELSEYFIDCINTENELYIHEAPCGKNLKKLDSFMEGVRQYIELLQESLEDYSSRLMD